MLYTLLATGATDTSSALDIREDDTIAGVLFSASLASPADGTGVRWELSFLSTASHDTNDTTGVLAGGRIDYDVATSGAGMPSLLAHVPMNVRVNAGERLYLHIDVTGVAVAHVRAYIHTNKGQAPQRVTRR